MPLLRRDSISAAVAQLESEHFGASYAELQELFDKLETCITESFRLCYAVDDLRVMNALEGMAVAVQEEDLVEAERHCRLSISLLQRHNAIAEMLYRELSHILIHTLTVDVAVMASKVITYDTLIRELNRFPGLILDEGVQIELAAMFEEMTKPGLIVWSTYHDTIVGKLRTAKEQHEANHPSSDHPAALYERVQQQFGKWLDIIAGCPDHIRKATVITEATRKMDDALTSRSAKGMSYAEEVAYAQLNELILFRDLSVETSRMLRDKGRGDMNQIFVQAMHDRGTVYGPQVALQNHVVAMLQALKEGHRFQLRVHAIACKAMANPAYNRPQIARLLGGSYERSIVLPGEDKLHGITAVDVHDHLLKFAPRFAHGELF